MFELYFCRSRSVILASLAAGALLTHATSQASAQGESGVRRTFLIDQLPRAELDFFSEDGIAVVVAPHDNTRSAVVEIVDDNPDELSVFNFDGTRWQSQRATFISRDGGAFDFTFWWKIDEFTPLPPPDGAFALIGPESDVEYQETVSYFVCSGGNCGSGNDDKLKLSSDPFGARLTVVVAVFSR